ncbi:MAG TPA: NAD-dependent epimerase/dehydratase family protein, partial [Candidatus Dormibacteraeota bacterium]
MKVAVTGGAGFIGSHLTTRLLRDGHEVKVIDNLSTGRRQNLAHLDGEVEILEGDIADQEFLDRSLRGLEVVFHVAALPSVPRSWTDPLSSLRSNAYGTSVVGRAAVRNSVGTVVYSSSSSVYGDQPGDCRSEDMAPAPISPYAYSKLLGEEVLLAHAAGGDLNAVALRYFNVFGPRQDPNSPYSAVIPLFITAALRGEPVTIYGDGTQSRDFTYVDNVVEGNLLALAGRPTEGEAVFNIACGVSITLLELVAAISRIAGREVEVRHGDP